MKETFMKYLMEIGITGDLYKRVEAIYHFYEKIIKEEIIVLFISEYITKDGTREYEHLVFFSENYAMSAKEFIKMDLFDCIIYKKRIIRWEINKKNYDFVKAKENSRMNLVFTFETAIEINSFDLKASKENCDYLKDLFNNIVVPNMLLE
ncbi:MAG: hypothetical protein ACFFCM_05545 [Promethearchaeota archaeon]